MQVSVFRCTMAAPLVIQAGRTLARSAHSDGVVSAPSADIEGRKRRSRLSDHMLVRRLPLIG